MSKRSPFDYTKAIFRVKNRDIMETERDVKEYTPYIVNKALSLHADCVLISNYVNMNSFLDNDVQYHMLLNMIRPGKRRYVPWLKKELLQNEDLDAISKYYGYSREKAKQVLPLMNEDDLSYIKNKIMQGGKS